MADNRLVSIITPSFNCADYIGQTIESILAQTYPEWELLVTDDCSTDNSRDIIRGYADCDKRIRLFELDKNSGAGVARNNSIKEAKGRYIAFCDSDDRWYPDKLQKQLAFMAEKDCAFSYTSYMTCDENGENQGIVVCRRRETLSSMQRDDKIGCLTAMYDTEKVGKVYMPELRKRQDWALKLKVLLKCRFALGMKEPLAIYRERRQSLSRKKTDLVKYNLLVYREILGWSSIRAYLFFGIIFMPHYILKKLSLRYINR